jgi:hypothetical protein
MAFNWVCPYCRAAQAVTGERYSKSTYPFYLDGLAEGKLALEREAIGCSNPDCRQTTIHIRVGNYQTTNGVGGTSHKLSDGGLVFDDVIAPRSSAKPQPKYIPTPLREDYEEACLIANLSPKASATLSRRCLQGMIRDFAKISKARLIDEIKALKTAVEDGSGDRAITPETVAAIDHVRSVGNIGAHMEADIDVIVPVDAGEAQAMIELIEMLFDEWYGARERRHQRLAKIEEIRTHKDEIKRGLNAVPSEASSSEAEASGAAALLNE